MKKIITAIIATTALAAPLAAQSAEDQRRWDYAQERYRSETARYQAERDRYSAIAEHGRRARVHLVGDQDVDCFTHLVVSQAQSSHGPSASMSAVSTVAPHQMRRPGGASR